MHTRDKYAWQFHYILHELLFLLFMLIEYYSIHSALLYLLLITILLFCLCYQTFASVPILKQASQHCQRICCIRTRFSTNDNENGQVCDYFLTHNMHAAGMQFYDAIFQCELLYLPKPTDSKRCLNFLVELISNSFKQCYTICSKNLQNDLIISGFEVIVCEKVSVFFVLQSLVHISQQQDDEYR